MDLLTPSAGLLMWGLILGIYLLLYLLSVWLVFKEKSFSPPLKVALGIVLLITPFIGPVLYIASTSIISMLRKPIAR